MEEIKHINHITIQRKEVRWNPNGGIEKEIYLKYKKPRRPRKWKKMFFKLHGHNWNKSITTGWMWLDDESFYPSQICKESNV